MEKNMTPKYKKTAPYPDPYRPIPLFPIYGYDNSEEAEKDFEYMKQLYPRSSHRIQELIEDTCDRLEYEGSMMFDEYPDRLQIALLANKIYSQLAPSATTEPLTAQHSGPPNRPHPSDPDWLRHMIEIMLCNEMCQRRRRYRSRRRWI